MRVADTEPRIIPTKAPTFTPSSEWDASWTASGVCVPDPERVRLLWDLPKGGSVFGGGGGAGPLSNEFPLYLIWF